MSGAALAGLARPSRACRRESLHSRTPIGQEVPAKGCPYRRVLCARTESESGSVLRGLGWSRGVFRKTIHGKLRAIGIYPGESTVGKLAKALGVDPAELVE